MSQPTPRNLSTDPLCLQIESRLRREDTGQPLNCKTMNPRDDWVTRAFMYSCRIPTHCGIEGNEWVDWITKNGDIGRLMLSALCRFETPSQFMRTYSNASQQGSSNTWKRPFLTSKVSWLHHQNINTWVCQREGFVIDHMKAKML